MKPTGILIGLLTSLLILTCPARGQNAATDNQSAPTVQLKLQIVLTDMEGTKKVSGLPYMLHVLPTTPPLVTQLRTGVKVPVSTATNVSSGVNQTQYLDIGINIDASAKVLDNGRYQVHLAVERSSVPSIDSKERTTDTMPLIRTSRLTCDVIVRDGQTIQITSASDPISGNVLLMDVTTNIER